MISCHWRIIPSRWLLRTAMRTGIWSCTSVASSCIVIWKPPSPTTAHVSRSGAPSAAPMAARPRPGGPLAEAPPCADLFQPLGPRLGLREAPQQRGQQVAGIGHDAEVGAHVLA